MTPAPSSERKLSPSVVSESIRNERPGIGAPLKIGDHLAGFEMVEELGQGAFARVFLAKQESLAGRLVALKVTLRPTKEPDRLARLQHTNIVPIYSVHNAAPVQLICMPFLGRRTIADLIRGFRNDHSSRGFVHRKTSGTRPLRTTTTPDPVSKFKLSQPAKSSAALPIPLADGEVLPELVGEPNAVLEVIGQLAEGLAHAHERGILHLDLKPANVLLADSGEPMLLDFNLSFDASNPERELVGGTVPYMSVEQLQDLRSRGKGQVDARTDLYSLGVMAFEMLTGAVPFQSSFLADIDRLIAARQSGPPPIAALNPLVTPAVEAIVRKLLEPDPRNRYQTAQELRTDIERHLKNLPLQFAREPSLRERAAKWRRRNPGMLGRLLAASFFGLAIGLGGVAYSRSEAIANTQAVMRVAAVHNRLDRMRLDLILPGDRAARKRGIENASEVLAGYGLPDNADWMSSDSIKRLPEPERTKLQETLGELLLLVGQARWLEVEGQPEAERRDVAAAVLKLNDAARTCFAVDAAPELLERQADEWRRVLGEPAPASGRDANHAATAREHFLDAAASVASGTYRTALASLEKTIEEQPGHAAAHFCLAYCRQQLGQYDRAVERYDAARVLMPMDPRASFERGRIFSRRFQFAQAENEFARAIGLDPAFAQAYRNRAVVRMQLGNLAGAQEDLDAALAHGGSAMQVHLLRSAVRARKGDAAGAAADQQACKDLAPVSEGDFIVRGSLRMDSEDFPGSLADFQAAEKLNPASIAANQYQVHLLSDKLHDLEGALVLATRGVRLFPEYAPARGNCAIVLARLGRREEAHREIKTARELSEDAEVAYQAACVYAVTSRTKPEDAAEALKCLKEAIRKGYQKVIELKTDRDLDAIRKNKEFPKIVEAATALK
jgi:serine/threonine protein kinase/Tfp pilus assembly protein PilF